MIKKYENFKNFENYLDFNGKKLLLIKSTPQNISQLKNMSEQEWFSTNAFVRENLTELLKNDDYKELISGADLIVIGTTYGWSFIEMVSVEPLKFTFVKNSEYKNLGKIFKSRYDILKKPHITFDFDNKFDITKLFAEKYPDIFNDLDDPYEAVERGGNMVEFRGNKVIYSFWDHKDRSGHEEEICKISDLIK